MDEHRRRGSPRLQFSKEELENDALARPIAKAEKAADKYEAAQKKLRKGYRVRLTRESKETGASSASDHPRSAPDEHHAVTREEEIPDVRTDPAAPAVQNTRKKPKPAKAEAEAPGADSAPMPEPLSHGTAPDAAVPAASAGAKKKVLRLKFEETQTKKPSQLTHPVQKAVKTAGDQLHRQVKESNEDDNVAVDQADGNSHTLDVLYSAATNKQFINPKYDSIRDGIIDCDYFLECVLPADWDLNDLISYALWYDEEEDCEELPSNMKRCAECQRPFVFTSNRQKYCNVCQQIVRRRQSAQRVKKYRA